jgi:hypothetical protein
MNFRLNHSLIVLSSVAVVSIGSPQLLAASPKNEAKITQVSEDVRLVETNAVSRPAAVNENINEGTKIRTGAESRAELTFANQAIARLGAETGFSFKGGARNLDLSSGAVLMQVPKNARGTKLASASVAVALNGATVVFEAQPKIFKLLVLEGTARLYRPSHLGDSVLVQAGQMVFGNPNAALSDPVDFDIGHFVKTCRLITDFSALHSERLMVSESQKQQRAKSKKALIDTNLVIFGGGSVVSLVDPAQTGSLDQATGASPAPSATSTSGDLGRVETLAASKAAPSPTPIPGTANDKSQ